ncbi:HNH endonuclease signature motif containing protein [Arthrobacter sp. zg-Y238]|uniref:HNH endonuclease n=1 Tax=Arthrobacter sp. zg-Y238 TaxID=2964614 RepID=UPI00210580C0|nr:HNH endonuclease signature motif containing protein [Arthrobacter sp. zg-Y238]MCQ1953830.1 HNH endonuclease [Arthrobacter sp. zg-Y238]
MGLALPGVFCVSAGDAPAAGTVLPPGLMGMLSLQEPGELGQEAALQTLERLNAVVCWVQAQQARTVYRLQELTAQNLYPRPDPYAATPGPAASAHAADTATEANFASNANPAAEASNDTASAATGNDRAGGRDCSRGGARGRDWGAQWDGEWVLRATAAEVGALLCLPGVTAQRLVADSEQLCTRCPETLADLEHGAIDYRRARTVVDQTAGLRLEDSRVLEAGLLPLAPGKTGPQFDRTARRIREGMFPQTIPERHRAAVSDRRVWVEDLPDGIGVLSAFLPAAAAHGIFNGLTGCARGEQKAGDSRTLDQLRADVFVSALTGQTTRSMAEPGMPTGTAAEPSMPTGTAAGTAAEPTLGMRMRSAAEPTAVKREPGDRDRPEGAGTGPKSSSRTSEPWVGATPGSDAPQEPGMPGEGWSAGGLRAEVMVIVSAESLLGLSDAPAELNGYGPISAEVARDLLANMGRWTGLLQGGDGEILAVGRQRRIPHALKRWLQARDGTCRFPGCSVAAENCELDHTLPWAVGGPTEHGNLAHLCKEHHRFKTVGLWKARQPEPGIIEWTSPMGRVYRMDAKLHGRDFNGLGSSGTRWSGTGGTVGTGGPSPEPEENMPPF